MVRTCVMLAALFFIFNVTVLHADDSASPAAKRELAAALKKMAGDDLMLRGSVAEEDPPSPKLGVGGRIVSVAVVSGSMPPYEGKLEVWRNTGGETTIMSRSRLPGFGVYDDGSRTLSTITFEGTPFAVSQTGSEIAQLLDLAKLQKIVSRADEISATRADGKTVYRCSLSSRLLRVTDTGAASMYAPKVLRIESAFTLNENGDVVAIEFSVVRNDPIDDIMRSGGSSTKIQKIEGLDGLPKRMQEQIRKAMKAQAVENTEKEGKPKDGKPKEGKTTVYRFEPIDDVSKEIRDFAARMRKMAEG